MPAQNRTGPLGQGPMTGRGLGLCGQGLRRGTGRGFRRFSDYSSKEEEIKTLKAYKEEIEQRLKQLGE